jgi:sec-independent protein translocase protein TatA
MNILGFGLPELIVVGLILLLFFGPKRLPGLFRSIGSSINEFKEGLNPKSGTKANKGEEESVTTDNPNSLSAGERNGEKQ